MLPAKGKKTSAGKAAGSLCSVPRKHAKDIRQYAKKLGAGVGVSVNSGRLLDVIRAIKSIQLKLREAGVRHAGVFGSTARGEDNLESDIDILIDIDVDRVGDILDYIDVIEHIKMVIKSYCSDVAVDVADHATLKPEVKTNAERDVIYAF
ncbi:MAG: nucleotidyltransferase domain-containing protein [Rhodospirillales bacterium]|nr:nucleotidyltransferase domain-containing protein [Rhodospirillales bacterium]